MKRRHFLATLAAGLLVPPAGRRPARAAWRFVLDGRQRWSLVSREGAAAVAGAEIAVRLAGTDWTPLAALDRLRRFAVARPRGGTGGWQVVGQLAGVEIGASFLDGPPATITVTARGLAEPRELGDVRFLDSGTARIAALRSADTRLWINGATSSSDCVVVPWDRSVIATGAWQLALLPRDAGGLALSFGSEDAAEGRFDVAETLAATARFGRRPVGMALSPASASLALVPGDDPMAALGHLASSGQLAARAPAGWTFLPPPGAAGGEEALLAGLEAARARLGPASLRYVVLDDGYQRSVGDWETDDRFPQGHRGLTDRIHQAGFRAGLWLAPFAVSQPSGIPVAHPEWLRRTREGAPEVVARREEWGGDVYALDAGQPAVQDYLRDLSRHAVNAWGYDLLMLDALDLGAGEAPSARAGAVEAYRAGLRALREGASGAFLLAGGAPLQPSAGLVDGMRVAPSPGARPGGVAAAARGLLLRAHFNGTAWINAAGTMPVGGALGVPETRAWASVVALCGAAAFTADRLDRLDDQRLDILRRIAPVAPVRGCAPDLAAPGWAGFLGDAAPAWVLAQVQDDWWMLAGVNWDDEPRPITLSLADAGLRGPLAAWDVWEGVRREDVEGRLTLTLAAHEVTVLSLRRPRRVPFVLGADRHVVQGLLDLEAEQWDARTRTLSGRALLLDGRLYELTIGLPPGFRPAAAASDPGAAATVEVVDHRAARLRIAAPPVPELSWSVRF